MASRVRNILTHRYLTLACRLMLGGVFIFAGGAKLGELHQFVNLVIAYEVLPRSLAQVYGYVLPPLELAIGAFLILGLLLRISSVVSILVLVSFAIPKGIVLSRGWHLTCGCFGDIAVLLSSQTFVLDFVLLALASQILLHQGEFLALGPWLKSRRMAHLPPEQTTT